MKTPTDYIVPLARGFHYWYVQGTSLSKGILLVGGVRVQEKAALEY